MQQDDVDFRREQTSQGDRGTQGDRDTQSGNVNLQRHGSFKCKTNQWLKKLLDDDQFHTP